MVALDKSEGAVMVVSEDMMVDEDKDSVSVIGVVWGGWAMSRPGGVYGLILPVLQMGGLLVDNLHEQDQRLYDRLGTSHERRFPAMSIETSSWRTHYGHAHRSTGCGEGCGRGTLESQQGTVSSLLIHEWLRGNFNSRKIQGERTWSGRSQVCGKTLNLKPDKT